MIGDSFTVDGKTYELQTNLKFGQYRKLNKISAKLNQLSSKTGENVDLTKIPPEEMQRITTELMTTNDEHLEMILEFLETSLGLKQEDIDNMDLPEAVKLFQETFKKSTTVNKALKKTSDSLYS